MADLPLLGVPAASPTTPPPEPPQSPTHDPAAYRWLLGLGVVALLLLAWRGHGLTRFSTSPQTIERGVVPLSPFDLNRASEAELASIPGLGEKLAEQIVEHREEKGEFRSVEDLRKVKGIGPATLERVRPFLYVGTYIQTVRPAPVATNAGMAGKKPVPQAKVDVNRATQKELQTLPGIGPTLSQRIMETREKQPFAKVEDLRRVKGIGVKTLENIRPYVKVGDEPQAEPRTK